MPVSNECLRPEPLARQNENLSNELLVAKSNVTKITSKGSDLQPLREINQSVVAYAEPINISGRSYSLSSAATDADMSGILSQSFADRQIDDCVEFVRTISNKPEEQSISMSEKDKEEEAPQNEVDVDEPSNISITWEDDQSADKLATKKKVEVKFMGGKKKFKWTNVE